MSIFRYVPISIAIMKIPPKLDTITCTLIVCSKNFLFHINLQSWTFQVLDFCSAQYIQCKFYSYIFAIWWLRLKNEIYLSLGSRLKMHFRLANLERSIMKTRNIWKVIFDTIYSWSMLWSAIKWFSYHWWYLLYRKPLILEGKKKNIWKACYTKMKVGMLDKY